MTIIMDIGSDPEIAKDVQIATQRILLILNSYIYSTKVVKESPNIEALRKFTRRYGLAEINKSSGQENRKVEYSYRSTQNYDCLLSAVSVSLVLYVYVWCVLDGRCVSTRMYVTLSQIKLLN